MKRFTLYLVWLCAVVLSSAQAADPQTDKEKLSYALGAFFGQQVNQANPELDIPAFPELDIPAFLQALEDVLSGAQTRLSGEQIQQIFSDYLTGEQPPDKEKYSYALGAFSGQQINQANPELDIPAFLQAVEDVLSGAQTRLSGEEMQQILSDY